MSARISVDEICEAAGIINRPSYYSGRGPTTSDLNDKILQRAFEKIDHHLGSEASAAFVAMVAALPQASATDFLIGLDNLARAAWHFSPDVTSTRNGLYPDCPRSAFGSVMSVLSRRKRIQEDAAHRLRIGNEDVRGAFLRRHQPRPEISDHSDPYAWPGRFR